MLCALRKSKTRIDDDPVTRARRADSARAIAAFSSSRHLGYDVCVDRLTIHLSRPSSIVHQDHRRAGLSHRRAGRSRSNRNPLMSLTIAAPRAMASRATTAL